MHFFADAPVVFGNDGLLVWRKAQEISGNVSTFIHFRFIRKSSNSIEFTAFSKVVTLNRFDMRLKSILYPRLMFIETALKSYVIEAVLADCGSENLSEVYKKSLTYYKEFSPKGGKQAKNSRSRYRQEFKKRKDLEMRISSALIRDYMQGRDIESHFFDNDRDVPL